MTRFYASASYQMKLPDAVSGVDGGVIAPVGIARHSLTHRDLSKQYPHLSRRLLDPQLYLAELNAASCRAACTNLSSYGWFPLAREVPFDSAEQKQAEWKAEVVASIETAWTGKLPASSGEMDLAISICLATQRLLGVEALILPAPLTRDPLSDCAVEMDWLDRGLSIAKQLAPQLPALASVAVSDVALRSAEPWDNPLVSAFLDQLTARGVTGAYIVPVMDAENSYYFTHPRTVGAILRLCDGLSVGGASRIVVNYAGTAGLLALGAGADTWVSGWFRNQRRMRLADFESHDGRTVPAYYSHPLGGEFHMENDCDTAVAAGLLPRFQDLTMASDGLVRALASGKKVNAVPEWRHQIGNKTSSIEHFLLAMVRETARVRLLAGVGVETHLQSWLDTAYGLSADLMPSGPFNQRTAVKHQHGWKCAYEEFRQHRF